MLTEDVPESRAQVRQDPAQACLVSETRRERFSPAHQVERIAVSTERDQRDAKVEPEVDGLGQSLRTLGNPREGTEGLLEPSGRGLVRGLGVGSAARAPKIRRGFAPRLAT